MPLVYTSLYFYFPLQSCYWKAGACEYSSVLLQQQAERSGSNRNNYLVYTLFMGWTAWKVPKFGKRCWKIPRKARKKKKKARHDHIDLHLGQKPQKVTVTVTVLLGKTGQQQGHRPFMPLFTWRVQLVGIGASHAVHVHNGRRGKTWLHQTFFINVWLCKVHNGW